MKYIILTLLLLNSLNSFAKPGGNGISGALQKSKLQNSTNQSNKSRASSNKQSAALLPLLREGTFTSSYRNKDTAKSYCRSNTQDIIDQMENELHNNQVQLIQGDVLFACKEIIFKIGLTMQKELRDELGFLFLGEIYYLHNADINIDAYCSPRSFEEKLTYSMARQCIEQPTEQCFERKEELSTIANTKFIYQITTEEACGLQL